RGLAAAIGIYLCAFGPRAQAAEAPTAANSSYLVKVWPVGKDKLPQSVVIAMTQTRDGYLWLGTIKGLVRFDGTRFDVFNEWNTPGLNGNIIVHLFEDSRGGLWVATKSGGLSLIKDGRATDLGLAMGPDGWIVSSCEDTSGAVWFYTYDGMLLRFRD